MCVIPGEYCGVIPGTRDFPAGFLTPPFIPPAGNSSVLICSVCFSLRGGWVPGALWDPSRAARPSEGRLWTCSSPGRAGHCLDSRDSPARTGMGTHGLGGGPWQVGGSAWRLSAPACPSRTLSTEALEEMTLKYIKFSLSRLSLWRPQPSHNARSQI